MALPTQKQTKSNKRKRALNFRLKKIKLASCPKCKKPILPHRVCGFCGTYAGREVIKVKSSKSKVKSKKKKEEGK